MLVALAGPTGSGKTALALRVAPFFGVPVLNMDSMQVYQNMNIGTAKLPENERKLVPHALLDLVDPKDAFSVADYKNAAERYLSAPPFSFFVGGTGLYLEALLTEASLGSVAADEEIRAHFYGFLEEHGETALHDHLKEVDPRSAERIHPHDVRRVIRALEVYTLTGKPISEIQSREKTRRHLIFTIDLPRDVLYARIDARVDAMMKAGLLREVEALLQDGVSLQSTAMQAIGYKELALVLQGKLGEGEAVSLIKQRSRNYAKRQQTYFRRYPERISLNGILPAEVLAEHMEKIICERVRIQ